MGSFLIANGFVQAKVIAFKNGIIDFFPASAESTHVSLVILLTSLGITLLLRAKPFRLTFAPVIAIGIASYLAYQLGIRSTTTAHFSSDMFASFGKLDFSLLLDFRVITAILIFFVVDFFGGVGKYIGLFGLVKEKSSINDTEKMSKALYVDGIGNIVGGLFGATTLSVFLSSAVGMRVGGKTGLTAVFVSLFILLSLFLFPLVGSIPPEAISGILVYIGCSMIPFKKLFRDDASFVGWATAFAFFFAALISFLTYSIDKSILFLFVVQSILSLRNGMQKSSLVFIAITVVLGVALFLQ